MTRRREERGAVAIMTALLAMVLLASASLAVDITSQASMRQQLHDTVDTSALSGALLLPDAAAAETQALAVAHDNDPTPPRPSPSTASSARWAPRPW